MRRYDALVRREGRWWMVSIPAINGLTQARRLGEAELMAREFIAVSQDVAIEDVVVDVTISQVGNVDVAARLQQIADERRAAQSAAQQADDDVRALAAALRDEQVAVRDIGAVLGVSHQRVSQILATPANADSSPA